MTHRTCGRCGTPAPDLFIPERTLDAFIGSGQRSDFDSEIIRCGPCADYDRTIRGTSYVSLHAIPVVRGYCGDPPVPSDLILQFRRMLVDIPSGC
ncbi:hypothetical protein HY635_04180 [Candidatus Uhrbacteria bacterium]|nr:hypothetical protein [Candidatus Uhrbacteria bacterium]